MYVMPLSLAQDLNNLFNGFLQRILELLPLSPFQSYIDQIADIPWLGILNWFVPVSEILGVMAVWLVSVALFYAYSVVMRWVKLIGD